MFDSNSLFSRILSSLMVFVFLGLGIIFLFVPVLWETFTGSTRSILGITLIVYSGFRAYRVIRKRKEEDE
jgi:hypothetical protein